jgi:hypothetical protein
LLTAVFHIPAISFLQVWGISLVIGLFSFDSDRFVTEQKRWNVLMTTLEHCVPEHKKEDLKQELKDNFGDEMTDMWASVGASVLGNSITLGFGFVIHLLVV